MSMSTQPKNKNWGGLRRVVGSRWTKNKSWEGSRMSTQPKKEIWEGSRRVVGLRWTQNKSWGAQWANMDTNPLVFDPELRKNLKVIFFIEIAFII